MDFPIITILVRHNCCSRSRSSITVRRSNNPSHIGKIGFIGKLPQESLDAPSLKQCFQRKGLSTQELVALSGAHTLGKIILEKPWKSVSMWIKIYAEDQNMFFSDFKNAYVKFVNSGSN
ncbi:hypothetical protein Tsubulata_023317 [Turnera subulata]|uniref:L-ascorbate peroxidase n=1 Tax=Turnera subulata TaxID=218843 RepID=A0A9Q0J8R3_9ROSI|nr:hypothetical protein Tsubulata_023317 [Turnera subulata]